MVTTVSAIHILQYLLSHNREAVHLRICFVSLQLNLVLVVIVEVAVPVVRVCRSDVAVWGYLDRSQAHNIL